MNKWLITAILVAVVLVFAGWYINGLNRIVRMDEKINNSWAEIDSQLKRRNDLIPNLVNTVKGYAKHEKTIFTDIAKARAALSGAATVDEKIAAAQKMDGFLGRLLAIVENYPTLKANESFQQLMDELSGTENRIAVARNRYNDSVKEFNTYIREVFGKFFAKRRGITGSRPYYQVEVKEKVTPEVKF